MKTTLDRTLPAIRKKKAPQKEDKLSQIFFPQIFTPE